MKKGAIFVGLFLVLMFSIFVNAVSDEVKEEAKILGCSYDWNTGETYGTEGFLGTFTTKSPYCVQTEVFNDEIRCLNDDCKSARVESCEGENCGGFDYGCRDLTAQDIVAYYGTNPLNLLILSPPREFYITKGGTNSYEGCEYGCSNGKCLPQKESELKEIEVTCGFINSSSEQICQVVTNLVKYGDDKIYSCRSEVKNGFNYCSVKVPIPSKLTFQSDIENFLTVYNTCGGDTEDIDPSDDGEGIIYYFKDCERFNIEKDNCISYKYADENGDKLSNPMPQEIECISSEINNFPAVNFLCDGEQCKSCSSGSVYGGILGNAFRNEGDSFFKNTCLIYPDKYEGPACNYQEERLTTLFNGDSLNTLFYCPKGGGMLKSPVETGEYCESNYQCGLEHFCIDDECVRDASLKYIIKNFDRVISGWGEIVERGS